MFYIVDALEEVKRLKGEQSSEVAAKQEADTSLIQKNLGDTSEKSSQTEAIDDVPIENEKSKEQNNASETSPAISKPEEKHEMGLMQDMLEKNSAKIKKLIQENSDLKNTLKSHDSIEQTPANEIKIKYDKCFRKLKLYREKICEIKSDRDDLRRICAEYSTEVSSWMKDIASASSKMIEELRQKKEELRQKNEEIEALKREKETQKKPKKTTVLDLEIEAYEKTLDELNKKLEAKKVEVAELNSTVTVQNNTVQSLKLNNDMLESSLLSEKQHSKDMKKDLDAQLQLLRTSEHEKAEALSQIKTLTVDRESLRLEIDEAKVQNAELVSNLEKRNQATESEKERLALTVSALKHDVDKYKSLSSRYEQDIETLRTDFEQYKVRAQGVLRQNQTKVNQGEEQELRDENLRLQQSSEVLNKKVAVFETEITGLRKSQTDLQADKAQLQRNINELLKAQEKQNADALEESRNKSQQHEDAIKAYQLQIDTLQSFYKKKIQEDDSLHSATVAELKSQIQKLEKVARNSPYVPVLSESQLRLKSTEEENHRVLSLADREEAEGSEDQSSRSSIFHAPVRRKISKGREMMPLDELLNSSFDDNPSEVHLETMSNFSSPSEELEQFKLKLSREENRVAHLTALLADSEKDLAKIQQMNDMLKEEVRKQQRNADRTQHLNNTEYLKNVVIKFASSNSGDEKQRLIPGEQPFVDEWA